MVWRYFPPWGPVVWSSISFLTGCRPVVSERLTGCRQWDALFCSITAEPTSVMWVIGREHAEAAESFKELLCRRFPESGISAVKLRHSNSLNDSAASACSRPITHITRKRPNHSKNYCVEDFLKAVFLR